MKKRSTFLVVTLLLMSLIISSNGLGASKKIVIKWGHSYPNAHPCNIAANKFASIVAKQSKGKIKVEIYPNGQLGSVKDNIEGAIVGTQEMSMEGSGAVSQFSPRLGIGECPYVWRDLEHMNKVMDGPIGDELKAELLKGRGLRILTTFYYGTRHLTANKPVYKLEDLKGLKLRTPQVPTLMEMGKAWGANPTPVEFGELYMALQTGVVDAQENPIPTIYSTKVYEVQKYLMLTGHVITPLFVMINERVWKSLTPTQQKIVMSAIKEARDLNNKMVNEQEESLLSKLKAAGMTIIKVDEKPFRKAAAVVPPKFEHIWGKGFYEKIVNTK
jgi:tripartite ATP-independent transporter DctP family solute receptor